MSSNGKVFLVIGGLWLLQAVLAVGPLRSQLEQNLIFSLVPGLDLFIEVMTLISESDTGSPIFYFHLIVVFFKDALIGSLISKKKR